MAGNPTVIENWFREYELLVKELQIVSPTQVWNMDETGFASVPKENYVLAGSGRTHRQVGSEQGELTTVAVCCNANGHKLPPFVIFKAKRIQDSWKDQAPLVH